MASLGSVIVTVGSQLTTLLPTVSVAVTTAVEELRVLGPALAGTTVPDTSVGTGARYDTFAFGMISSSVGVAPMAKSVDTALAVQLLPRAPRASVTVTVPSVAERLAAPVAAEARFFDAGTETASEPAVSVKVVAVSPGAACAAG